MANPTGTPETLTAPRFEAGKSGNPGGQPKSRQRLTTHFLNALADDFEVHGKSAIEECRKSKPDAYIKAIAALCPKEVELKRPLQELDAAELLAAVRALEGYLAAVPDPQGTGEAPVGTPTH